MPCKEFLDLYKSFIESSPRKTTWIFLRVRPMVHRCLDLVSSADDWCYVMESFRDFTLAVIDSRFVKEAEEALRKCVELMKRDMALAEALAGKNKPEPYEDVMKGLRRFLRALREASAYEESIDRLMRRYYVLAELTFPQGVEDGLRKELERINHEIGAELYTHEVRFRYRGKKLVIGEVSFSQLLESAEFVATEEKAVRDILTAVRRALPDYADKIEEAIEKLRLFKKLLDQTAEVG